MLLSTVWIVVFCLFCLSFDPATGIPVEKLPGKTDSVVAMLQQSANMQENTHAHGKTVENTDVQTNSKSKQDEEAEWFWKTKAPTSPGSAAPTASPTAEHWSNFGCGPGKNILPCNRVWGGRCEPGIIYGYNCKCNDNVLGATCDWNNKSDARVLTRAGITPERLNMAFYFANIVYADVKDPKKLAGVEKKCPRFKAAVKHLDAARFFDKNNAEDSAATYAAVATVAGSHTPSGKDEVVAMFRGTEFSSAKKEIMSILNGTANTGKAFNGLRTVFTDLTISKYLLNYTDPKTGEYYDLGYVHQGFWNAIAPFYYPMLLGVIEAANKTKLENPTINVVGHSLGGALANIFASLLHAEAPDLDVNLITFGAPRVGDAKFNEFLRYRHGKGKLKLLRVVAGRDPITMIPTSLGWNPLASNSEVIHAGEQLTIGEYALDDKCRGSFIESQWDLLHHASHLSCLTGGINKWHTDYYRYLVKGPDGGLGWFQAMQIPEKDLWCTEKINF